MIVINIVLSSVYKNIVCLILLLLMLASMKRDKANTETKWEATKQQAVFFSTSPATMAKLSSSFVCLQSIVLLVSSVSHFHLSLALHLAITYQLASIVCVCVVQCLHATSGKGRGCAESLAKHTCTEHSLDTADAHSRLVSISANPARYHTISRKHFLAIQ